VLPLAVRVTDPGGMLEITATLGVCSDICIPARASLSIPLTDPSADAPSALRIRQAMAGVPIDWDGDAEAVGAVSLAVPGMLAVEVSPDLFDTASLIAATDQGEPLFGVPQKSPQPNLVLLPILGKTDNSALDGKKVELTFMTERGAYKVRRTIQADRLASMAELTAR
jgi:DsbC/DsbD-like thiol-disulfide interchange protein